MENWIYNIVKRSFDIDELEEAIEEKVSDLIDYEEIAESILDEYDVTEIAKKVAEEEI